MSLNGLPDSNFVSPKYWTVKMLLLELSQVSIKHLWLMGQVTWGEPPPLPLSIGNNCFYYPPMISIQSAFENFDTPDLKLAIKYWSFQFNTLYSWLYSLLFLQSFKAYVRNLLQTKVNRCGALLCQTSLYELIGTKGVWTIESFEIRDIL